MFLDASSIVAIIAQEEGWRELACRIEAAKFKVRFSPLVVVEAVMTLVRRSLDRQERGIATAEDFVVARKLVTSFLAGIGAQNVDITASVATRALDALEAYGKEVGHAAEFNIGDVFSYACAKMFRIELLHAGYVFKETDGGNSG